MRPLDRVLIEFSERGDEVGADLILDRLERSLADEPDPVVVDLDLRRSDVQTMDRQATTSGGGGHSRQRGWLVAAALLAAVGVAVALAVVLGDGSDTESGVATVNDPVLTDERALMGEFAEALHSGDVATARDLVSGDTAVGPDFVGWVMALNTAGVTFDCEFEPGAVACDTTMGPDHFYERIHGQNVHKQFEAQLDDGFIVDPTWPVSSAEEDAERDFRAWAEEAHPELGATMFDGSSPMGVAFTEAGGQARMQILDEYLEASHQALMGDFIEALQAGDAETARGFAPGEMDDRVDFVGWVVALDTTRVTFDCEFESGAVACDTTMGPDHFYERIHGQNVHKQFEAQLDHGLIVNPTWPAHSSETSAEDDFRAWVEEAHPELVPAMFDGSQLGVLFTVASGATRMQLLDEYLASR